MQTIHKAIHIHSPVEKVFDFVIDPRNMPGIWTAMVEVSNLMPATSGGFNFDYVYKMAGIKINGFAVTTEFIHNQRLVNQSHNGVESRFTWEFKPLDNGTELTLTIEYQVPVPVLGHLAETLITRQNDQEIGFMLENLKHVVEQEILVHI